MTQTMPAIDMEALAARNRAAFGFHYCLWYPEARVFYSFTPKNGCTTLKFSLGRTSPAFKAKGAVHANDAVFRMQGTDLPDGARTLIVLRDPFQRAVSAYYEKMITPPLGAFARDIGRRILADERGQVSEDGALPSFAEVVRYTAAREDHRLNVHLRPQSAFWVLPSYHAVFALDDLNTEWLNSEFGHIPLHSRRPHAALSGKRKVGNPAAIGLSAEDAGAVDGATLRRAMDAAGAVLAPEALFRDRALFALFCTRFRADILLYAAHVPNGAARPLMARALRQLGAAPAPATP